MNVEIRQKEGYEQVVIDDQGYRRYSKAHWKHVNHIGTWARVPLPFLLEKVYQEKDKR